jgi:electron transfer flavoprotein alpha subunit
MILVIAEESAGRVNRASMEVIAAAQHLGGLITVVMPSAVAATAAAALTSTDVAHVVALAHAGLAPYTPDAFVVALAPFITAQAPSIVLMPHTYQTRDYAPRLAARLNRPLVTDCVGVRMDQGALVASRPMFQGKLTADVRFEGTAPHLLTLQIGAFRADAVHPAASPVPVRVVEAAVTPADRRQRPDAPFREAKQAVDLSQAERIVAVGRGIKEQAHIALAQQLAAALGAELAASRPVCDLGWLPMDRQVGSSGQTVAPRLYLALGISGAIQHIVGMKGSRTIVAVNKDVDAPIFEVADYGIVGDLFEVVPAMIAALQ